MRTYVERKKLRALLDSLKGATVEVVFTKKDGSERRMKTELGAEYNLKGGTSTLDKHPEYYVSWDVDKQDYRAINLLTTKKIIYGTTEFIPIDSDAAKPKKRA